MGCAGCTSRYPIVDTIPIMSDLAQDDPGTEYKRRQIEFFDGEAAEFEISRPQGQPKLYGWLMEQEVSLQRAGGSSRNWRVPRS